MTHINESAPQSTPPSDRAATQEVDALVAFLEGKSPATPGTKSITWTREFAASGSGKTVGTTNS